MAVKRLLSKHSIFDLASRGLRFAARALTSRFRTLPDFLIIGAQRSGTTSLYNYLVTHPAVFPAFMKETHFFDLHYKRNLNWYRAYFPLTAQKERYQENQHQSAVTGEATPYYLFHPQVPERVSAALPAVKLIVLLRNPVHRAFSHYQHEVKQGFEQRTFEAAISQDLESMALERVEFKQNNGQSSFEHMHYSYVARGIYMDQLSAWMNWFSREQILVLPSEAFYLAPAKILADTLQFLELPGWEPDSFPKYNVNQYLQMSSTTQQTLAHFYAPHNQRLFQFMNVDFGW